VKLIKLKSNNKDLHFGDKAFYWFLKVMAFGIFAVLFGFIFLLLKMSWPIFEKEGLSFFVINEWNPITHEYGALAFIFGTILVSLLALAIALPMSIGSALLITEIANKRIRKVLGFLIEMLAAIPSVVYGLWGLFVLVPLLKDPIEPFLLKYFGFLPLFQGMPIGTGILAASLVLSIMIVPTIASTCREIFLTIPKIYKEGALALGATKWEMITLTILKGSVSGIFGASILGLGRAIGETMAVTMVIGNRPQITASLLSSGQTMASLIVNEYAEASWGLHTSALMAIGLTLLLVSLLMNSLTRIIVWRVERKYRGSR